MSAWLKAFDTFDGRSIALKRLASNKFATPKDLQRAQALFEREYHVLAQLAHPKIIEVYDYGVDDLGAYYTVQQLAAKGPVAVRGVVRAGGMVSGGTFHSAMGAFSRARQMREAAAARRSDRTAPGRPAPKQNPNRANQACHGEWQHPPGNQRFR